RSATCRVVSPARFEVSRGSNGGASTFHGRTPSAGLTAPLPLAGGVGGGPVRPERRLVRPASRTHTRPPLTPPASGRGARSNRSLRLLPRQQLAEPRMREVHRHVVAIGPGLADFLGRQQPVGPDCVLG